MDLTLLAVFFAGVLVGLFIMAFSYSRLQKKLKEYQRKLEKTSVKSDEGTSKIDVLEAKIKVLEKALQSALEKNNE